MIYILKYMPESTFSKLLLFSLCDEMDKPLVSFCSAFHLREIHLIVTSYILQRTFKILKYSLYTLLSPR